MAFLLDTNVLSELRRRSAAVPVVAWQTSHKLSEFYVSVISLMEIRNGTEKVRAKDPVFAEKLDSWYHERLLPAYRRRILQVDLKVAETRSTLSPHRTLPHSDALIAATAKHHRLTIVTRNTKDFEGLGIDLTNPWEFGPV
jgi:predicted nucleic acid-binding protein